MTVAATLPTVVSISLHEARGPDAKEHLEEVVDCVGSTSMHSGQTLKEECIRTH